MANEPGMPRGERVFKRLDSNQDGKISRQELGPPTEKRFLKIDADNNGTVTSAEIDSWLRQQMERRKERIMSRMDGDRNGDITRQELDGFIEVLFKEADTDQDGGVSLTEARAFRMSKLNKLMQDANGN